MSTEHLSENKIMAYLMEEASLQDITDIELHLENCEACRNQVRDTERMIRLFHEDTLFDSEENALIRARNRLENRLHAGRARKHDGGFFQRLFAAIPSHIETRQLAAAVLFTVIGIFIGHHFHPPFQTGNRTDLLSALKDAPAGTVRVIPSGTDQDVQFHFRNTEESTYRGRISDPEIQTALAYTLLSSNEENLRIRSMDLIQTVSHNETVESALLHTLINDPNPGMRYRAIKLLSRLPINSNMKNLLVRVLFRESNPGVRMQAAEKLLQSQDPDVLPILEQRAKKDEYIQYVLEAADTRKALEVSHE